jgi:hypothetical protein
VLDPIFKLYQMAGLPIHRILCDNEYRPLEQELKEAYDVIMNFPSGQEHVPDIERTN